MEDDGVGSGGVVAGVHAEEGGGGGGDEEGQKGDEGGYEHLGLVGNGVDVIVVVL